MQEVERMSREAEAHAAEDMKRKEQAEAKNNADNAIYTAEKTLREFGDKAPENLRQNVEKELERARQAMQGEDPSELKERTNDLLAAVQALGTAVHQQANSEGEEQRPDKNASDEDVVDGEFKEA